MTTIKLRRGTAAEWTATNPVLSSGEPGVETDTGKQKLGDGVSTWNALGYFLPDTVLPAFVDARVATQVPSAVASAVGAAVAPEVTAQLGASSTVQAAAASAVSAKLSDAGLLYATNAPSFGTTRWVDPQGKDSTSVVTGSGSAYDVAQITTGLPAGISYGWQSTRKGTLSNVIGQIRYGGSGAASQPYQTLVTPGEVLSFSAQLRTDQASAQGRIDVQWWTSTGSLVSTNSGSYVAFAGANTWEQRNNVNLTVPATAHHVTVQSAVSTLSGNTITAAKSSMTAVMMTTGNVAAPAYVDGSSNGWAWSGAAFLSTAKKWSINPADLTGFETPAGSQAKVDAHAAASDPHTGYLQKIQLPELARNRVPNPQVKGGSAVNPSSTAYLVAESTTGLPTGYSYATQVTRQGSLSGVVADMYAGTTTLDMTRQILVIPAEIISIAALLWSNDPATGSTLTARVQARFYQTDGTLISTPSGTITNLAVSTWEERQLLNITVPALAARMIVESVFSATGGTATAGSISKMTGVRVVSGSTAPPANADGTFNSEGWIWTGVPHASPSIKISRSTTESNALVTLVPSVSGILAEVGAAAGVKSGIYSVQISKNLFNPLDPDVLHDMFNASIGTFTALSGYEVSGFIPVTPGSQYTIQSVRGYEWYNSSKVSLGSYTNTGSNLATVTLTAPGSAAYIRITHNYNAAPNLQMEAGAVATSYEAYYAPRFVLTSSMIDAVQRAASGSVSTVPLTIAKIGNAVTVSHDFDGSKALRQTLSLNGSNNGAFNIISTALNGTTVHANTDDICPIRTQMGTVGANHGYANVSTFANPDGKTNADLGSVWTDGTREYVLLGFDTGLLVIGGSYTTDGSGIVNSANVNPSVNLTHVSGATHTGAIDYTTMVSSQLHPSIQRVSTTLWADGKQITADGSVTCSEFIVRESYAILDYASIYDTAKANVGTSFASLTVATAVRLSNRYRWTAGGCRVTLSLTELKPTTLGTCGAVQSTIMSESVGAITRYLPGVGTVGGSNWGTGVSMAAYASTTLITSTNITNATRPPALSLDVLDNGSPLIGYTQGYLPYGSRGDETSSSANRLTHAPTKLWDMRSTKKNYPSFTTAETAGWGHLAAEAFRAYLTPTQIAAVLASKGDAASAWEALNANANLAS